MGLVTHATPSAAIQSRSRRLPVAGAALLSLLLAASLAYRDPVLPGDGITWALPLGPGRAIRFALWTNDFAFSSAYTTAGLTRQRPGPLRLTIAYQHPAARAPERLLVLKIVAWPFVVVAGLLGAATTRFWCARARRAYRLR